MRRNNHAAARARPCFRRSGRRLIASPAAAQQSVADFYKGKNVALLLGTGPGGSYDLYARIFAEHLGKHIPGNPIIMVEHMPGAGGVTAGNHLFGPGPQDGTKILLSHAIIMSEVLDPKAGVRFQSPKFNWIGTYDAIAHTLALWHEAQAKTIADLKKHGHRRRLVRQGALHLSDGRR